MTEQLKVEHTIWTWMNTFLRLFILVYFFFYMFPFPLEGLPVINYYDNAIEFLTIGLGENLLQLDKVERIKMTGSGDTTFDYIRLIATTAIAFFVTLIVFVFTATKHNYHKLSVLIFTYARYYLALFLLSYGFAKFHDGQFPFPEVGRLDQKFGDASPMGLLWTFMGYSKSYVVFSGICEVLGGFLLFFRRTTVLGAIISLMVMINVVMLNFAYDVPVKLLSSHLALISIFILSPNIVNLIQFFIFRKAVSLKVVKLELTNRWLRYGRIAAKSLIIIAFPVLFVISSLIKIDDQPMHSLNAEFTTEEFIKNNDTILPFQNDSTRWNKFFITDNFGKIIFDDDKELNYKVDVHGTSQIMSLTPYSNTVVTYKLKYDIIHNNNFVVSGLFGSDSISATFKLKRKEDYELVKRGFHWINEYPYNR